MKYILSCIGHQHWLRVGFRYRLARLLSTNMSYIDRHIFFFGGLELQELQFLTRYLTPQSVVFDTDMSSFTAGHSARNTVARRIPVLTGDTFADGLKLDLLKIDVEGYEKEVLTGLKKAIKRDRPVIYMEYMKTTQDKFGSLQNLLSFLGGYQAFTISVNRPKWIFFNDPKGKLIPYNGSKDILLLPQ